MKRFAAYVDGLKGRIEELGVGEAVKFLGHRDDVLTLIAGSDIVVMPSVSSQQEIETEGFPLIALEALAVGTPVVAYRVGGLPELVGDCAVLVHPRHREGLLDVIERVATDRALWERMSECGSRRVSECFSIAGMIGKLQHVYRLAKRG